MTQTKFKTWELVLIVFSFLLVAVALFFILSGKNIYPALIGLKNGQDQGKSIGILQEAQGEVKRQPVESASFKVARKGENLLNDDMLITGGESGATVKLEDEATIVLGPNTMAKLSFDDQLGLSGISRNANVTIIAGHVTVTSKNSSVILKSIKGELVTIGKDQTQQLQVENTPTIKPKPKIQEVKVEQVKAETTKPLPSVAEIKQDRAEIKPSLSTTPISAPIPVPKEIEVLTLNPILFGGKPLEEAYASGKILKNIEITLSWKPIPNITEYEVKLINLTNNKVILNKKVNGKNFTIKKGTIYTGAFEYQVTALGLNGLKINSSLVRFELTLKAPLTTSPSMNAVLSTDEPTLFIWSKVSFAENYELEIYLDEGLKKSLLKQNLKENFLAVKDLKKGVYFWRVKALTASASSDYSTVNTFTIKETTP